MSVENALKIVSKISRRDLMLCRTPDDQQAREKNVWKRKKENFKNLTFYAFYAGHF